MSATATGKTLIPVASSTGFGGSHLVTIDIGANQETAVVVSTTGGIRRQVNSTITVAAPLKFTPGAPIQYQGKLR